MKAIVFYKYGSPDELRLEEHPVPKPMDTEVLVKVHAASINALDWHMLTADIFLVRLMSGIFKPKNKFLGADFAGQVEAVGAKVTQVRPGDEVFGLSPVSRLGSFAEYVCASEELVLPKPPQVSFEEMAALPVAALTALQALRDVGKIQAGQQVLINGASGGVGTFAVQLAKLFGAEVTAVCSTRNLDQARALGADHVVDYTREDITKNARRYDLILSANGYRPLWHYWRLLKSGGIFSCAGGTFPMFMQTILLGPLLSRIGSRKFRMANMKDDRRDLMALKAYVEAGTLKPVIDARYPLHQVPDAMRYMGEVHPKGKIIITMGV